MPAVPRLRRPSCARRPRRGRGVRRRRRCRPPTRRSGATAGSATSTSSRFTRRRRSSRRPATCPAAGQRDPRPRRRRRVGRPRHRRRPPRAPASRSAAHRRRRSTSAPDADAGADATATPPTPSALLNDAFADARSSSGCRPAPSSDPVVIVHWVDGRRRRRLPAASCVDAGADSEVTVLEVLALGRRRRRPRRPGHRPRRRQGRPGRPPRRPGPRPRPRGSSATSDARPSRPTPRSPPPPPPSAAPTPACAPTAASSAGAPPATCGPSGSARPTRHLDFRTFQDHAAPDTTSDLVYKGAVGGRSRSVYTGLIRVGRGRPGHQRHPDQPQPQAVRRRLGRVGAQPRDREQRRALRPRLGRRPGRRGAALVPREPGRARRRSPSGSSSPGSSTRSSPTCPSPAAAGPLRDRDRRQARPQRGGVVTRAASTSARSTTSPPARPGASTSTASRIAVVRIDDDLYAIGDTLHPRRHLARPRARSTPTSARIECWKHGSQFALAHRRAAVAAGHPADAGLRRRRSSTAAC